MDHLDREPPPSTHEGDIELIGLPPPLSPRARARRLAVAVASVALALVVVIASIPTVRQGALTLLTGPPPAPTLPAGAYLVYLLPNPPGMDVLLDGHIVSQPSVRSGADLQPVQLSRGQHQLSWRSRLFPFRPMQCTVSVPHAASDSCPFVSQAALAAAQVALPGAVIALHGGLGTLAPDERDRLTTVMQAALDAQHSTALVQPGEQYSVFPPGQPGQVGPAVVALQPLRAALSFTLVADAGYMEPCLRSGPAVPCRFVLQDCSQLCTVAQPPASVAATPDGWIVAALVRSTWDYQTLDGQLVAHSPPEISDLQLAVLRITWDGARWQASAVLGHTPRLDLTDDAACDPAREALSHTSSWSFMITDPPVGAQEQFVSDGNPTDGCVAALNQPPATIEPAMFLERFGVLLTVNDVARNPADALPVADAGEQHLAQQLLAQVGGG